MNLPCKKFEQIWFLPRWSEKIIASSSLVETFRTQSVCVCPNKPVVSIWNFFLLSLLYLYRQNIWTRGQQGYGTVVSRVLPDLDKKSHLRKLTIERNYFECREWISENPVKTWIVTIVERTFDEKQVSLWGYFIDCINKSNKFERISWEYFLINILSYD